MRRVLHLVAAAALAAFVLPTARLTMVSLHVALEDHHDHADTGHAGNVEASLHGHDHAENAGAHEHTLVSFEPTVHRARMLDAVAFLVTSEPDAVRIRLQADPRRALRTILRDHGPPDPVAQGAILRV